MPSTVNASQTQSRDRVNCWTCGVERGPGGERRRHRADNPVLAHDRCAVCNDVLMPYPQPSLNDTLGKLGGHLREALRWSQADTVDTPTARTQTARREIQQLLEQAHAVYVRHLDPAGAHTRPAAAE